MSAHDTRKRPLDLGAGVGVGGASKYAKIETDARMHDDGVFAHGSEMPVVEPLRSPKPTAMSMSQLELEQPALSIIYVPGGAMPKLHYYIDKLIEIRIPVRYLSSKNKEVATRQLWGTDVYTDDSDAVAMLMHTGQRIVRSSIPASVQGVAAMFRVLAGQASYPGVTRYNYRSRSWASQYQNCSLQFVRLEILEDPDLFRSPTAPVPAARRATRNSATAPGKPEKPEAHVVAMAVVGAPVAKAGLKARRRMLPNVVIVFNNCNEPCLKYSLVLVGDRGMDKGEWTSTRLKKEVMYFEADNNKYELSRSKESDHTHFDMYTWGRVKGPYVPKPFLRGQDGDEEEERIPLPPNDVEILERNVDWESIEWGPSSIRVNGKEYEVRTVQYKPRTDLS